MATVGGKSSNELVVIASQMKQFDFKVSDLKLSVAAIDQLRGQISRNPTACKADFDKLATQIANLANITKSLDSIAKNTSRAIVK